MKKEDLKNLEIILEKICENNDSVFYKFFQDEKGNPFGIKDDEDAEKYFIKLSLEFEKAEIAYYDKNSFVLVPISNECLNFKNEGGFNEFYKKGNNNKIKEIRKET